MAWLELLAGGVLLYFGAEWFVGGAAGLARGLRVPELIVGLTVVAYGTSAPEVIVGVEAARSGHGAVALGNVLGSNVVNVGLILGLATLIAPAKVDGALRRRELPILVASAALVPLLLVDGVVSRVEGATLVGLAVAYSAWMVRAVRSSALEDATAAAARIEEAADLAGAPSARSPWWAAGIAGVGLLVLLLGGSLFVRAAVEVATGLGMGERLVGLTIVAVGTSLPELVTSVVAARRGSSDIAIGNVVGSNIFNVLLCLGGAALTAPIEGNLERVGVDVAALLVMTALAAVSLRSERTMSRAEGGAVLLVYAAYLGYLVAS
jgi:cation:H+ antiporter